MTRMSIWTAPSDLDWYDSVNPEERDMRFIAEGYREAAKAARENAKHTRSLALIARSVDEMNAMLRRADEAEDRARHYERRAQEEDER